MSDKQQNILLLKNNDNPNKLLIESINNHVNDINGLYPDIGLSTTTITCTINLNFNTENLGLYFDDFDDYLIDKRYGNRNLKYIIDTSNKKSKKKIFNNQISFIFDSNKMSNIVTLPNTELKKINIKFFTNGSIHITGCNNFTHIKTCLSILCLKIKKGKIIIENNETKLISYVSNPDELKIENIYNFNIRMANICFDLNYCIDRHKLDALLIKNGYNSNFNQINKSVIIKYIVDKTSITIFVFNSGSITIAGTKSIEHLMEAYYFINNFILSNYSEIYTKKITPKTIIKLLQKMA